MLHEIVVGGIIASLNVALHVFMIVCSIEAIRRRHGWLNQHHDSFKILVILTVVTHWLLFGLLLGIGIWAAAFQVFGLFPDWKTSLYFASVAFTTLGFGDVLMPEEWQLLAGLCAAVGLMLFGLSTAYLFEVFRRLLEVSGRIH